MSKEGKNEAEYQPLSAEPEKQFPVPQRDQSTRTRTSTISWKLHKQTSVHPL